jgi:hypothetical protein
MSCIPSILLALLLVAPAEEPVVVKGAAPVGPASPAQAQAQGPQQAPLRKDSDELEMPGVPAAPKGAVLVSDEETTKGPAAPAPKPGDALVPELSFVKKSDAPLVGEEVELHIKLAMPMGYSLQIPTSFKFPETTQILRDGIRLTRSLSEDGKTVKNELVIPFRVLGAGWILIPPQELPVETPSGGRVAVQTAKRKFHTGSHFANESQPAVAAAFATVPLVQTNWFLIWGLIILGVIVTATGSTIAVIRFRRAHYVPPPPPPVPAHVTALGRLAELERKDLLKYGLFSAFYTGLSETMREYLGNRWGFDSMDLTTTELRSRLKKLKLEGVVVEEVVVMLQDFDLVKFAKVEPGLPKAGQDLEAVRTFITRTIPRAATTPEVAPQQEAARR